MRDIKNPALEKLLAEIRACRHCRKLLPLPPRPVIKVKPGARLLIVSHAPGLRVHESGVNWDDPSGVRLRQWLGLTDKEFYGDEIAIADMGFCYPGKGKGGDLPPRPECAQLWRPQLDAQLGHIKLTLLVGQYAQNGYLKDRRKKTLTETVRAWREYLPLSYVPLVHPSGRNQGWLRRNPWFARELLPELRRLVAGALR